MSAAPFRSWDSDRDRQRHAAPARSWPKDDDERRELRRDVRSEWPPDAGLHPRTAAAWAMVERLLAAAGAVTWTRAAETAMAAGPLGEKAANQLLSKACKAGAAHWTGQWEYEHRTLFAGPGVTPVGRPAGSASLGRSAPRRRRPSGEWTKADIRAIGQALGLIDRYQREISRDIPESLRRAAARLLELQAEARDETTDDDPVDAPAEDVTP